ncbi:MAG: DEAD/DEAH box helicase [Spirochaetes bacterium]|nr:DEAD/DEAH box helicase [Spirochaetota bacterium]
MSKPLIIQSDNTILLEVDNPDFEDARDSISPFAELEKSPEHIHTYRISPLSLWNAAASGLEVKTIIDVLAGYTRYDIPDSVITTIKEQMKRYGLLKLVLENNELRLVSADPFVISELLHDKKMELFILNRIDDSSLNVNPDYRGHIKQALIKKGFPVEDLAGYEDGDPCDIKLRDISLTGNIEFSVRDYQKSAINAFYRGGGKEGGSGVIVLPCGAGKTIVGIGIMSVIETQTLILVTNTVALRQWKDELLDKTYLDPDDIGEFSGAKKEIKPVTIATYNILTYRKDKKDNFLHFGLFKSRNWGLIVYDEVHLLPAPVFRMTSEIQSKRRLGLTATLIREDGLETDVFSLIGPKKYDIPWKILEKCNWIASAMCTEIRIELDQETRFQYSIAREREKFRMASENSRKLEIVQKIMEHHKDDRILIIGQYLDQLKALNDVFKYAIITGSTPVSIREDLYEKFRKGEITRLVVSRVANFSVDLPDANVAIQISGTFGSRQEEAQRLGRILRPKTGDNKAFFYTVVTSNSVEEKFAHNRHLFLAEEGYEYTILNEEMFNERFL